jgi:hypothetical protein|tara:strand:- start:1321 stop:1491 length:171 start_codon:yes stop_codon:yes gene_type:complete
MKHQLPKPTKTPDQTILVFECTFFDELGHENYSKKLTKEVRAEGFENLNHYVFSQA